MDSKFVFRHMIAYYGDQSIDIRTRMMYFLEYASFFACFVGTVSMVLLKQPFVAMVPNIILLVMSFIALYFSHVRKKYTLSTMIMVVGCANFALPWMFFVAGGNESGMPIWMVFGIIVICMMLSGKSRALMLGITIAEDIACMLIGHLYPDTVIPLVGEDAAFYDMIQSFAVVCICLTAMLSFYIATYEKQRQKLEAQGIELRNIMQTDALTGVFNRRAYYDEIAMYSEGKETGNLVLVAMDVNGLKKVNDLLGHSAGDDYIRAAAKAITQTMGMYGHIFRTGGDEFMALLHCSVEEAHSFEAKLGECISQLDNSWTEKMTIAVGVVCSEENPRMTLVDAEKLADKRMYENKAAFYKKSGIDRRK